MKKDDSIISHRKDRVAGWFKDPVMLMLVLILVLAFIVRLYFFISTPGQALWWDEAEYGATAKNWALDVPYDLNAQRPPLFQFLWSLAIQIGLSEATIKFLLVLLPSLFLVYAVYLLGSEMFDKKIGLIAAFLTVVSWSFLFWGNRFQPDFFSMVFQVLSIMYMWRHWKTKQTRPVILAAFFAALGFYFKVSALLVPMIFIVFILVKERLSCFKNKYNYYFALAFIVTLIPYIIWSLVAFHGNPLAFRQGYTAEFTKFPIGWYNLKFYYSLTEGLLFALFIIGVILALRFLLYLDVLVKDKEKCFDPELFGIIALVFISCFYIFYMRNTDDRWVFLWLPFIFFFVGKALMSLYTFLKKYSRILALTGVIVLLAIAGYAQFNHAQTVVLSKKDSYGPVRQGGIWMKDHSSPGDKVLSISYTQSVYYTERNVSTYSGFKNAQEFDQYLTTNKPKYLQVSIFEPHPDWIFGWVQNNSAKLKLAQAYFADQDHKTAVLVIYEFT